MKTLQTQLIINEVLETSVDKCTDITLILDAMQTKLSNIISMGLIELDYRTLDANVVLYVNEKLHSIEEELYETLTLVEDLKSHQKENMDIFS